MRTADQTLKDKCDVLLAMRRAWKDARNKPPMGGPLCFEVRVYGLTEEDLKPLLDLLADENQGFLFTLHKVDKSKATVEVKERSA
jgi:hypothetical protein